MIGIDNRKVALLNSFVSEAYECNEFSDFLRLAIQKLHKLVVYDSAMFFCAISRDCSYFKPYTGGNINDFYKKSVFAEKEAYQNVEIEREAYVYKAADYSHGIIQIDNEPRSGFLSEQSQFYIVCIRIIHKGQFLGEIYLHRSKEKPDFSDEDIFMLRLIQPHVSKVFNIIHTTKAIKFTETSGQKCSQKGMCIFDQELSLVGGNVTGIEMLKMATKHGSSILYHVKEMCLDLLESDVKFSKSTAQYRSMLFIIPDNEMRVDVYAQKMLRDGVRFVITMELTDEGQALSDYKFKFSKREAEIIDAMIQGKNNIQLAELFHLSENTVKTHLKNIYKKTGTNNRTELSYVLMLNK